jgi:hypothetical protein
MTAATSRRELQRQRAELKALTDEIGTYKSEIGRAIYEIGRRLARVYEDALWRSDGYANFEDYLTRGVSISRTTAYRFMRIARHFNAEIAKRYGVEKLEAAIRYLQATPAEERPGDLLAAEIRLRDESGRFTTFSLHEATAAQIREATALLFDARRAGMRIPSGVRKRMERLAEALPPAPSGTSRGERVRLTRGKDGHLAVSFHAIPLDELRAFLELLEAHLQGR